MHTTAKLTAFAALLACLATACGHASAGSTLADSQPNPQAPMAYSDGLPVIPLDPAGFRGAVQGPLTALIYFQPTQPIATQTLQVLYSGYLNCEPGNLTLGVVQNGVKVGDYAMPGQVIDVERDFGHCTGEVPLSALKEGDVYFYVYDGAGEYDSNEGQNYGFALNYQNIIP